MGGGREEDRAWRNSPCTSTPRTPLQRPSWDLCIARTPQCNPQSAQSPPLLGQRLTTNSRPPKRRGPRFR
eukprot:15473940-Alexandrium_andersonii.AAC.1